jgi:hypothetical protein
MSSFDSNAVLHKLPKKRIEKSFSDKSVPKFKTKKNNKKKQFNGDDFG